MGLAERFANWIVSKSDSTASNPAQWFIDWAQGGHASAAGVHVSPETAMHLSAVFACVRIRSEDIGKLPCLLYERLGDGGKRRAADHPLFSLIRDQPNEYMTAFEFRQVMQAWVDLRGNAYALKDIDGRGRITALWPVNPIWVTVLWVPGTWELFYQVAIPGMPIERLPADAILHLRGMSLDGRVGLSPIAYHRETIGLGIAAQKYGAAFFGNSAQPQGAVKVPGTLSKAAAEALRVDWENKFKGVDNAKRLAIFDGGLDWVQTGMDNTDAQYLETRKFQNQQIYGIYRMPAHKAGDLERSTNNNIEHQALEYVTDCLMTEMVRWEQTLKRDLLLPNERSKYFFEFVPDALLRGDIKSRYDAYAVARNWGWLNVDEIREKENMNPLPGDKGKVWLQPLNMVEAGTKAPPQPAPTPNLSPDAAKEMIKELSIYVARAEHAGHLNGANGHA
jgi:HK97 family phage portal protein